MVKQEQVGKTSSRKPDPSRFPSRVVCAYQVPLTVEAKMGVNLEGDVEESEYVLFGTLDLERIADNPPQNLHLEFANLLVDEPKAVQAFIKRHGVINRIFFERDEREKETEALLKSYEMMPFKGATPTKFALDRGSLDLYQDQLRGAWDNDWSLHKVYIESSQDEMELGITVNVFAGTAVLRTADPWTFICFLFLRDFTTGRLAICENPDCPAPYFRKKRKTQKYCEAGPCVAYAQRQYSLHWWNREGKKRREKKAKAQHRRSKA